MQQACSCRCGASRFMVSGEPIGRFFCHCTICQAFNSRPFADVAAFFARAVTMPQDSAVAFRRYRPPPAVDRGSCPTCGGPVVAFMALGPLKFFAFVPSQNFERPSELPESSLHIFYDRRVAEVTDTLPKVSGYWSSETAVSRMLFGGMFRTRRVS